MLKTVFTNVELARFPSLSSRAKPNSISTSFRYSVCFSDYVLIASASLTFEKFPGADTVSMTSQIRRHPIITFTFMT
jgi:hypothetical protein